VILQAADPIEAIRLQATRLYVLRRGKIIASAPPNESVLNFGNETRKVDFTRANIAGAAA
jgi:cytosine deaminase